MPETGLSDISSDLIRATVKEAVENLLNSKECKIDVESASQSGENNFIGIVYRVTFCENETENKKRPISKLILKLAPQNLARREQFISRPCFLREIYMYNVVSGVIQI